MGNVRNSARSFLHKYFWHLIISIVVIGGLANLLVWLGPWRRSQPEALELPSYPVELVARGRGLYQANCASCHGQGGEGYAHPNFLLQRLIARCTHGTTQTGRSLISCGTVSAECLP